MSSLAIQPPALVFEEGDNDAPYEYTVPGAGAIEPTASTATFDGTNAAGPFLAALFYRSQSGQVISRVFPTTPVQAGDVAQVSYAPFPGGLITNPSGGGVTEVDSFTLDVTNNTGPDVEIEFPQGTEETIGAQITLAGDGQGEFSFAHVSGATLLDLTTPTQPAIVASGEYAVNAIVGWDPSVIGNVLNSKYARFSLFIPTVGLALQGVTLPMDAGNNTHHGPVSMPLPYTGRFGNGTKLSVQAVNDDAADTQTFNCTIRVEKVAPQ